MQLESMYQEIILDHYRHPHHKGLREPYDAEVHHVNPLCGDEVTVRVSLKEVGGEPRAHKHSVDGAGILTSLTETSGIVELGELAAYEAPQRFYEVGWAGIKMAALKRPNAKLVLVPVVNIRVVRMGVLDRLVYVNVRVRFLILRTIRVLMLMMLIVDVPVFMYN